MRIVFFLLCPIAFAISQQAAAQTYVRGMDSQRTSAPPQESSMLSNAPTKPVATSTGAMSASISLSDGTHSGISFPVKTGKLTATYTTKGTSKGDKLEAVWISRAKGPAKKISVTKVTGEQADFNGSVSLSTSATGWPAGNYEVLLVLNDKVIARRPFTIK